MTTNGWSPSGGVQSTPYPVPPHDEYSNSPGNGMVDGWPNGHLNGNSNGHPNGNGNSHVNGYSNGYAGNGHANGYVNGNGNGHPNGNGTTNGNGTPNGHVGPGPLSAFLAPEPQLPHTRVPAAPTGIEDLPADPLGRGTRSEDAAPNPSNRRAARKAARKAVRKEESRKARAARKGGKSDPARVDNQLTVVDDGQQPGPDGATDRRGRKRSKQASNREEAMSRSPLLPPEFDAEDPGWEYRGRPVPKAAGWALPGGGRASHVEGGVEYQATTTHVCGLFPFSVASGANVRGVPIGRHMLTAEPIGLDPSEWLRDGLISNTGIWVQGQPGIGKSTIVKRLFTGMIGFGFLGIVPGDVKGEYTALVEALGGRAWRIGRGMHSLNPLDPGPMRTALRLAQGEERKRLEETIRARQLSLLEALLVIVRGAEVTVTERRLLGAALDIAVNSAAREPIIPDVLRVLVNPSVELMQISACRHVEEFLRDARELINTLGLCCEGAIRGIFDRPSSINADLDTRALSLDISALDDDDDDVVAAAMLCSWTWSASLIDGAAAATGERRNVVRIQDELWRALRVAPGLVERSDKASRLDRTRGEVTIRVTHSFDDLRALRSPEDQAKARGLASRSAILILGGMADSELADVSTVTPMSNAEFSLVRSWGAPPTWVPGSQHPGRGKYLIKSGDRMGLPVSLSLVPSEMQLYDTESAWYREANR